MNQLALGASFPFVVAAIIYARRKFRCSMRMLVLTPLLMGLAALWAVIPDIPRLMGREALYHRLARDPRADIFFWHYSIDLAEADSPLYSVILVMMFVCVFAAAWRELRLLEES